MEIDLPSALATNRRAILIAPAGCGKTALIARAVCCSNSGCQLILTHTHAGVRAIRDRLRQLHASNTSCEVTTIASFTQKFISHYPSLSGITQNQVEACPWNEKYLAAVNFINNKAGKEIIHASWAGMYVDEYQDCTKEQHNLVCGLAQLLPCRILGDPLQGIFNFETGEDFDSIASLDSDFEVLRGLETPWRWHNKNERLGEWLLKVVRENLLKGRPIDLHKAPPGVIWMPNSTDNIRRACYHDLRYEHESVIVMRKYPQQAHDLARRLGGCYASMDEVEGKDLLKFSEQIDDSCGVERALTIVKFAELCFTGASTGLKTIKGRLEREETNLLHNLKTNLGIAEALTFVIQSSEMLAVLKALESIENSPDFSLFRNETWRDMKRALKEFSYESYDSLYETAKAIREQYRIWDKWIQPKCISRVLLVKGLEFDHAIVLDTDRLNVQELYVAMTRGAKTLTILSAEPIIP